MVNIAGRKVGRQHDKYLSELKEHRLGQGQCPTRVRVKVRMSFTVQRGHFALGQSCLLALEWRLRNSAPRKSPIACGGRDEMTCGRISEGLRGDLNI